MIATNFLFEENWEFQTQSIKHNNHMKRRYQGLALLGMPPKSKKDKVMDRSSYNDIRNELTVHGRKDFSSLTQKDNHYGDKG